MPYILGHLPSSPPPRSLKPTTCLSPFLNLAPVCKVISLLIFDKLIKERCRWLKFPLEKVKRGSMTPQKSTSFGTWHPSIWGFSTSYLCDLEHVI